MVTRGEPIPRTRLVYRAAAIRVAILVAQGDCESAMSAHGVAHNALMRDISGQLRTISAGSSRSIQLAIL